MELGGVLRVEEGVEVGVAQGWGSSGAWLAWNGNRDGTGVAGNYLFLIGVKTRKTGFDGFSA